MKNPIKTIDISLSPEFDKVEIHTFADLHLGDQHCDKKLIYERIKYVQNTDNAFAILNGDLFNNATKTSVSDSYSEDIPPMEQIQLGCDMFEGIKDKILVVNTGNHENRTYNKEGVDLSNIFSRQLGIFDRFGKVGCGLWLSFGTDKLRTTQRTHRKMLYSFYVTHGMGGGKKEGAKAMALVELAGIVDTDIYLHAHTHLPMILKEAFLRQNRNQHSFEMVEKLFVNAGATLNYGGYGQQFKFKPSSKANPVIWLNGNYREMEGRM